MHFHKHPAMRLKTKKINPININNSNNNNNGGNLAQL